MNERLLLVALAILLAALWAVPGPQDAAGPAAGPELPDLQAGAGQPVLQFEANVGQADDDIKFLAHGPDYNLFLTHDEAVLLLPVLDGGDQQQSLSLQFVGATSEPDRVVGLDRLPGIVNYYLGQDPEQWHQGVPTFSRVKYQSVFPGIDLIFYGNDYRLEHDFIVSPGADPDRIAMKTSGVDSLQISDEGELLLSIPGGELALTKPVIYQEIDGSKREVKGGFELRGDSQFGFQVAAYDADYPLVIDPVLEFSTYFGGSADDYGRAITTDSNGNIYVTGATTSTDFPLANASQSGFGGGGIDCPSDVTPYRLCYDAFVSKFNANGTGLIYSTYIGLPGDDEGNGIAVDTAGNAYMTGMMSVNSQSLPDMYIYKYVLLIKLNASGSLVYGGWFGSNGSKGNAIAVDAQGRAHVTGEATGGFPTTADAIQPERGEVIDGFVSVFSPDGSQLEYSTYLGGDGTYCDVCYSAGKGIAVDSAGIIYVTGQAAPSFPTTANAYQRSFKGFWQAFVTKIDRRNAGTAGLVHSTYLGGSQSNFGMGITLDTSGKVYVTGSTQSDDFPTTSGAFDRSCGSDGICNATSNQVCDWVPPGMPPVCHLDAKADFFVAKLDLNLTGAASLIYSTYIGGSGKDEAYAIDVDSAGNAYVIGSTVSPDFPLSGAVQGNHGGNLDVAVLKLNATGSALKFSTFMGGGGDDVGKGIVLAPSGKAYITGHTGSMAFPVANPLAPRANGWEAFVARLNIPEAGSSPTPSPSPSPSPSVTPDPSQIHRVYLPSVIK